MRGRGGGRSSVGELGNQFLIIGLHIVNHDIEFFFTISLRLYVVLSFNLPFFIAWFGFSLFNVCLFFFLPWTLMLKCDHLRNTYTGVDEHVNLSMCNTGAFFFLFFRFSFYSFVLFLVMFVYLFTVAYLFILWGFPCFFPVHLFSLHLFSLEFAF